MLSVTLAYHERSTSSQHSVIVEIVTEPPTSGAACPACNTTSPSKTTLRRPLPTSRSARYSVVKPSADAWNVVAVWLNESDRRSPPVPSGTGVGSVVVASIATIDPPLSPYATRGVPLTPSDRKKTFPESAIVPDANVAPYACPGTPDAAFPNATVSYPCEVRFTTRPGEPAAGMNEIAHSPCALIRGTASPDRFSSWPDGPTAVTPSRAGTVTDAPRPMITT